MGERWWPEGDCLEPDVAAIDRAEIYDPVSNRWVIAEPMLAPRAGHTATVLTSGQVLLTPSSFLEETAAELYEPTSGTWAPAGHVVYQAFNRPTATLLPDGDVLLAGGAPPYLEVGAAAQRFTPDNLPPMVYHYRPQRWPCAGNRRWVLLLWQSPSLFRDI